ncbi:MAG TPA: hypothetical protein VLC08_10535 [Chitinolyticbacter sp.]|nr:hypothetical protein [Chitinolyticbacter sp.]
MTDKQTGEAQPRQADERRSDERREAPDDDQELWRWMNMVLNGNERRASVGRRMGDHW